MKKTGFYDHKVTERHWQDKWLVEKLYQPDLKKSKKKFYNLWMFPYPSAEGLHAGHAYASTGSDIYGRFKRMSGYTVFEPVGYDSFGIHSENFALKIGEHPKTLTARTTRNYERQMKSLGHGYDWSRTVTTSDVDYYKWTQWLFVKLFKAGLAYRKKATVNYCPGCRTVLSDEQIMSAHQAGKIPPGYKSLREVPDEVRVCERCGSIPEKKELEQWFFKITKYADRLLANLDKIDWPEKIKLAQKNWIGRSEGMLIDFETEDRKEKIKVFTTRPDTLNAATFIAIADEDESKLSEAKSSPVGEKQGKFTGKYAVNPLNGKKLPVWKANFVSKDYGTGAIMGVPAHDERDREFAQKYKIEIIDIKPDPKLPKLIEKAGYGVRHTNYHLRDWLISRQRYWGPPIPMIYCAKDGWVAVAEEDLPVVLPDIEDYSPEGTGRGPLANHPEFYKTKCPKCGGQARRETDVSDTFLDSSWYFLRYPSVGSETSDSKPFDPKVTKDWLPVDLYFGGAEHALLHLMYARFITMALFDLNFLDFEEPFPKFFAHGLMIKDGAKMSKSRGNVVNPDEYIEKYGADTLRLYEMFLGPMDGYPDFRDTGIEGMQKFTNRVWDLFVNYKNLYLENEMDSKDVLITVHQTIKKVTEDIQEFRYNTAIASIMEFVNLLREKAKAGKETKGVRCAEWDEALRVLAKLLAPFAPHITEELWVNVLGEKFSVHKSDWPGYDPKLLEVDEVTLIVQVDGKVRGQLTIDKGRAMIRDKVERLAVAEKRVAKWLTDKKYETVFVPGKIINFVTK